MATFLRLCGSILEEGLIYGIMAMGVYISYRILDFPDLSVDGTWALGMCVTAVLIRAGVNPLLGCLAAFLAGGAAGCLTGWLHVQLRISKLLSGILVMTASWTVNLLLTDGRAVLAYYDQKTIFSSGLVSLLSLSSSRARVLVVVLVVTISLKLLLDHYLQTKSGLLLRATGDNQQFVIALAVNPGHLKIIGLAIANGLVALAGSVLGQQNESANIASGTGVVVIGLAAVIIGTTIFGNVRALKPSSMVVAGAILYKACLMIALQLGLPTNYLKLLMAGVFTLALVLSDRLAPRRNGLYG